VADTTKSLGKLLKWVREKRDLRQGELGAAIDEDQATISAWETGKRIPTFEQRVALAEALDWPTVQFLTKEQYEMTLRVGRAILKLDTADQMTLLMLQSSDPQHAFLTRALLADLGSPMEGVRPEDQGDEDR
jgi:transcriptional regulator with XRE-family HTH domain